MGVFAILVALAWQHPLAAQDIPEGACDGLERGAICVYYWLDWDGLSNRGPDGQLDCTTWNGFLHSTDGGCACSPTEVALNPVNATDGCASVWAAGDTGETSDTCMACNRSAVPRGRLFRARCELEARKDAYERCSVELIDAEGEPVVGTGCISRVDGQVQCQGEMVDRCVKGFAEDHPGFDSSINSIISVEEFRFTLGMLRWGGALGYRRACEEMSLEVENAWRESQLDCNRARNCGNPLTGEFPRLGDVSPNLNCKRRHADREVYVKCCDSQCRSASFLRPDDGDPACWPYESLPPDSPRCETDYAACSGEVETWADVCLNDWAQIRAKNVCTIARIMPDNTPVDQVPLVRARDCAIPSEYCERLRQKRCRDAWISKLTVGFDVDFSVGLPAAAAVTFNPEVRELLGPLATYCQETAKARHKVCDQAFANCSRCRQRD
jgi:hypothetical protein